MVKFFIEEKECKDWEAGMQGAAYGGHVDMVLFFIEKGAKNWHWGLRRAAHGGFKQTIEFFIKKHPNCVECWEAMIKSASYRKCKCMEAFLCSHRSRVKLRKQPERKCKKRLREDV